MMPITIDEHQGYPACRHLRLSAGMELQPEGALQAIPPRTEVAASSVTIVRALLDGGRAVSNCGASGSVRQCVDNSLPDDKTAALGVTYSQTDERDGDE